MTLPSRFRAGRFLAGLAGIGATLLGLLFVTFLIGRVVPIDPVLAIAGDRASADQYEAVRRHLGLDLPLWQQFARYVVDVLHGDFGVSVLSGRPVAEDIVRFFPATVELATTAIVIGVGVGVPLGVAAAVHRGRWIDHLCRLISLAGYSMPVFWLGLVGLLVFYARLGWVSGPGRIDVAYQYAIEPVTGLMLVDTLLAGDLDAFGNAVSHLVLPAAVLGYHSLAYIARMTRSFMLDQLRQEYVTTARAKGLSEFRVIWRHALGNALVPLITTIALAYGYQLEGAVLTETVFAWPGIGLYITQSLFSSDLDAVLGGTLVVGLCYMGLNLAADGLYAVVDPRTK